MFIWRVVIVSLMRLLSLLKRKKKLHDRIATLTHFTLGRIVSDFIIYSSLVEYSETHSPPSEAYCLKQKKILSLHLSPNFTYFVRTHIVCWIRFNLFPNLTLDPPENIRIPKVFWCFKKAHWEEEGRGLKSTSESNDPFLNYVRSCLTRLHNESCAPYFRAFEYDKISN